eukprot:scaffold5114_cov67-Cylindrotheca_fusiformis.AAC.13
MHWEAALPRVVTRSNMGWDSSPKARTSRTMSQTDATIFVKLFRYPQAVVFKERDIGPFSSNTV